MKETQRVQTQTYHEWLQEYSKVDMNKYAGSESKYLKAADLGGKVTNVTIAGVALVEFDDDDGGKQEKPCLKLEGKEKMIVCNATSVMELGTNYGFESDNWIGKEIRLSTKFYPAFDRHGLVITALGGQANEFEDEIPF